MLWDECVNFFMEKKLQSEIIKWLKERGAYVIKTKPGMGTPVGCPDILFLYEGSWGAIEVKASRSAPWRVGQEATFERLRTWSTLVYKAFPENWITIKAELQNNLF